jgi:hypothetical protein
MLNPKIVIKGLPKLGGQLRQAEKDYISDLKSKSRAVMQPLVGPVRKALPVVAPLSGMAHNGRTQYVRPNVKVYAAPRVRNRKRDYIPIVGFRAGGPKSGVGFDYAELAGIRRQAPRPISKGWNQTSPGFHSYRVTGQGDAFIRSLEKIYARPGRFFFRELLKDLPMVRAKVRGIVEDRTKQLNRELRR